LLIIGFNKYHLSFKNQLLGKKRTHSPKNGHPEKMYKPKVILLFMSKYSIWLAINFLNKNIYWKNNNCPVLYANKQEAFTQHSFIQISSCLFNCMLFKNYILLNN